MTTGIILSDWLPRGTEIHTKGVKKRTLPQTTTHCEVQYDEQRGEGEKKKQQQETWEVNALSQPRRAFRQMRHDFRKPEKNRRSSEKQED